MKKCLKKVRTRTTEYFNSGSYEQKLKTKKSAFSFVSSNLRIFLGK